MAYQPIGKIAMTPKGNWVNNENYQQLDIVTYKGNIYIALNDIANHVSPESAPSDWQLLLTTEQVQSDLNTQINQLQNMIGLINEKQQILDTTINIIKNIYGAPAKASSVNEMTDTNRVYVYTGETSNNFKYGFWYYYNGSAWDEGGQYNSLAVETDSTLTLEGVPADAKATGELKTAIETSYSYEKVAGGIATVENTIEASLNSFTLYGKSVQNGTPSPSSPMSIATAGSSESIGMVSVDINTDIHIPITDTIKFIDENGNITDNADYLLTDYIPLSGNYLYIQWENVVGTTCYLRRAYYDSNKSFIRRDISQLTRGQSGTFWTPLATARYVRICVENSSTNRIYGLQLHNGYGVNIPTPNGLLGIPVVNGGNYIDKNGQRWVCDTIDLNSGVYTKRCGVVTFDGSETWTAGSISGRYYVIASLTPNASAYANHLCTHAIANSGSTTKDLGKSFFTSGGNFDINTSYESADAFKAALATSNMTLIYELTTPVIAQLTEAQLTAIRSLHSRRGMTCIYSVDPVFPGFDAEVFVNVQSSTVNTLTKMNSLSVSNTGKIVTIDGTIDAPLGKLVIYGKSTKDESTIPTPSAPVSIITAGSGGTLPIVSAGKNLIRKFVNTSGIDGKDGANGCNWTYDAETGTYTLTSTVGSGTGKVVYGGEIGVRNAAGQTLTLSAESITGDSNASVRIYQGENNELAMIYGSVLSVTFQVPNNEPLKMLLRMGNTTASGVTAVLKGVQLEVGSARTAFAPMLDKLTTAIPTPGGLSGVPVPVGSGYYTDTDGQDWICDTIDLETGIWTKRCGTFILDNSRTDYNLDSTTGAFYIEVDDLIRVSNYWTVMMCDSLSVVNYQMDVASTTNAISGYRNFPSEYPGKNWMYFTIENVSTLSDLNTWLATHPIKVVYVLATPIVTKLTNTQLVALESLRSRKGQTNLYSTDPTAPEFQVETYIDTSTYITNYVHTILNTGVSLSGIIITPDPSNRFRPYFQPWIKEYTLTVIKGNTITIAPQIDDTNLTVRFADIATSSALYYAMHIVNNTCELDFLRTGYDRGISIIVSNGIQTATYFINLICVESN